MIRTLPPVHPNSLCSPRLGWDKFPAMPRPAKLPDLSDVDITELKLMILAVLERHGMGPEWRRSMRGAQIGGMLDLCGGARQPRRL